MPTTDTPAPAAPSGDRITICNGRYEVFPGTAIPHMNQPGAKAYAVQGVRGGGALVGLVPDLHEFPRHDASPSALNVNSLYVFRYVDTDVAYWPEAGRHRPVVIIEKPAGQPCMNSVTDERPPLPGELHFKQAVESLHDGLRDIYLAGLSHGRINPTNLFIRESGNYTLLLGECLSTAPGKYQHYGFETIERMMAKPVARGPAASPEDIYAAGVSLLLILLGRLPALSMPPEELLQAKIEKGSMMALLTGMKLPSAYSEFFRGVLSDDPELRWGLDDISHWLGGRRMGSKPAGQLRKAQRTLEFGGRFYLLPRLLANAMSKSPDMAARIIEDDSLDRWLRRSIGDEEMAETLQEAISSAASVTRGGSSVERLVSRACVALDSTAPIRFRDVSGMPTGLGALLAELLSQGQQPRTVADIISSQIISFWSNQPNNFNGENTAVSQIYEGLRMLLERNQPGYGIERILYELNLQMPCLSPMLDDLYPLSLKALAQGIERHSSTVPADETTREPMDRHIAAFILSRHKRMNDRLFPLLDPKAEKGSRAIATLSILAEIQKKFHNEPMPHTSEWLARLLAPSLERYNNRALRDRLGKELKRASRKGDLEALLALVDDSNVQRNDKDGFYCARTEWSQWEKAARELSSNTAAREAAILTQGRQITAFIGIFAAAAIVLVSVFSKLF